MRTVYRLNKGTVNLILCAAKSQNVCACIEILDRHICRSRCGTGDLLDRFRRYSIKIDAGNVGAGDNLGAADRSKVEAGGRGDDVIVAIHQTTEEIISSGVGHCRG